LPDKTLQVNVDDYFFPDNSTAIKLPCANVAKYMLDELEANQCVKKGVCIGLEK
jgi:hypothetical protein